ncbi:lytic transglycosylase domain-containing protein [Mucilaginibacter jinjuensis]|uniref:Lytic transglycosylase domain-containing protein n=1 Tax=Mucilaginibacter jinjuensis TaxID=1176721 RepID=A0ABY7T5Q7_9SPHI|nr:lytic transglycosylase domain-containing protein [Mucilaginibacter jinjuensis]WCT11805.1 lytic transglycosylase domain-containing protein [Mucilaginibacter jinjuensis]
MIKKHLFTCSVILVSVVILKLFVCSTTESKNVKTNARFAGYLAVRPEVNEGYNFAHEAIPVTNKKVGKKFKVSLWRHSYNTVGSIVLHKKASKLFPIIEPILLAYGIPEDFKYIPLVESGLKSGTSPKGAAGLWQFMPQTARDYGLKVGKGVDERLNVRKSTIAACKYLRELYGEFNSWTLTAAAYNGGSPRVARAINKHNQGNYYLMALNPETASYVYKLIAMKAVIQKPKDYGYHNVYASYLQPAELLAVN